MAVTPIRHQASARGSNPETVLSTGLNSLASGSGATSAAISNTELDTLADLEFVCGSITPGSNAIVDLYLVGTVDGTNYGDTPGLLVGAWTITSGTGAKREFITGVPVPPRDHKWHVVQRTGVTLPASGNTVKAYYYRAGSGS